MATPRMPGSNLGKTVNARTRREADGVTGRALFRCDRCKRLWLESDMVWQDGLRLCGVYCATATSRSELDVLFAEEQSQPDSYAPVEYPPDRAMLNSVIVTAIDTSFPITVYTTDPAFDVEFTGVGLSSADAPTAILLDSPYTETDLTASTVFTSTLATVTIDPSALVAGDYSLEYAGTRYFRALKIL